MMNIIILALAAALVGCAPNATDSMPTQTQSTGRVTVERVGVIRDDIAYRKTRGIYVIRDNKTGREFIGVSGVGISETGTHSSGKNTIVDEQ